MSGYESSSSDEAQEEMGVDSGAVKTELGADLDPETMQSLLEALMSEDDLFGLYINLCGKENRLLSAEKILSWAPLTELGDDLVTLVNVAKEHFIVGSGESSEVAEWSEDGQVMFNFEQFKVLLILIVDHINASHEAQDIAHEERERGEWQILNDGTPTVLKQDSKTQSIARRSVPEENANGMSLEQLIFVIEQIAKQVRNKIIKVHCT